MQQQSKFSIMYKQKLIIFNLLFIIACADQGNNETSRYIGKSFTDVKQLNSSFGSGEFSTIEDQNGQFSMINCSQEDWVDEMGRESKVIILP